MMDARQKNALEKFDVKHVGLSKGSLSFALIITRNLRAKQFPVAADDFRTAQEGQVARLGGGAVRKILKEHGVERVLSDEGGRTSRGNMGRLRAYLDVLNDLWRDGALDLEEAERFWVSRVCAYFDSQPFTFKLDPVKSLRHAVGIYSDKRLHDSARSKERCMSAPLCSTSSEPSLTPFPRRKWRITAFP